MTIDVAVVNVLNGPSVLVTMTVYTLITPLGVFGACQLMLTEVLFSCSTRIPCGGSAGAEYDNQGQQKTLCPPG